MNVSHKWLKRYLPGLDQYSPTQIAEAFTMSLADVEHVLHHNNEVSNVVVGEVMTVEKHPDSKKLSICTVNIAEETLRTILCGAPNVAAGQKVAVCLPGGTVHDAHTAGQIMTIAEREIAGSKSQGMICSEKELGLGENHDGILVLEPDAKIGSKLDDLLTDFIYEIENKALGHRPDCFSHMGLARELSAILTLEFLEPQLEELPIIPTAKLDLTIDKKVNNELSPRFSALLFADVTVTSSPLWLKAALASIGIRPINNIVDVTNYVMADKGQPMHAYDYDKLANKKLVIRESKSGEQVTTLDGKEYKLDKGSIVITDGKNIEDIAGIMGGAGTQITSETKNIVLEAANFNMYSIRRTSRYLGLRTEASMRFEKGQDPSLTEVGLKAAATLIQDLSSGEVASELLDIYPERVRDREIQLDFGKINRFLGIDVSKQKAIEILASLNLALKETATSGVDTNQFQQPIGVFVIPTYRKDLVIDHDLLEEIVRIYGFAKVPSTLPERDIAPVNQNPVSRLNRVIVHTLTGLGFDEVYTYSFVDPVLYGKCKMDVKNCLEILNPIAPELSHVRTSLLPSIIKVVAENSNDYTDIAICELGRGVDKALDEKGVHIQPHLCAGALWQKEYSGSEIYSVLKGKIESMLATLNIEVDYEVLNSKDARAAALHPGRSAQIVSKQSGRVIGILGEAHPEVLANFIAAGKLAVFELNSDELLSLEQPHQYKALSTYPAVSRDLSFMLPAQIEYAEVEKQVKGLGIELIREIRCLDVFMPANSDQKSITITVILQSSNRTLTGDQISEVVASIVRTIERNLGAKLRQ